MKKVLVTALSMFMSIMMNAENHQEQTIKSDTSKDRIDFPNGRLDKGGTQSFSFKQQDADTRQIRLVFEARFDWNTLGGYTGGLKVNINGQKVTGARLLNKPLKFKTRTGGESHWAHPDGNGFILMYSPDFSNAIKTNKQYKYGLYEEEQEAYRFVLDLTGLTQHVGVNQVTFEADWLPVIFQNVSVEFDSKFMSRINDPKSTVMPAPTGALEDFRLKTPVEPEISIAPGKNGALVVKSGNVSSSLTSRFSLPDGKWMETCLEGEPQMTSLPCEMEWKTPQYMISRKIKKEGFHLKISDTFTNLRDEITGVMFENVLVLPETPVKKYLGGLDAVFMDECESSCNPSIGAQIGKEYVSLLMEDDIFRSQGYLRQGERFIAIGDRSLGLPPKGRHTLEWSIYIVPGGGYYDFINAVRRDWKSNFTIDGPFSFPYGAGSGKEPVGIWLQNPIPQKTVNDFLSRRPVNVIITHVAADPSVPHAKQTREKPALGHGTAIPECKWWSDMTRNMTEAFKAYAPQVKVYAYIHKNLCAEQGNREKYQDSMALDSTYKKLSETGVCAYYVPTLENSYGKRLEETYKYLVENLGTNIYMDEICLGVTAWEKYPEWDDCTVAIDRGTHRVKHKLSIPNLLAKPWLEKMLAYLESQKRGLIANGPPVTRALLNHHMPHFVEQCMGRAGLLGAHLSSPLAFCYGGEEAFAHFRDALECGMLCFMWSGDLSNHIFPFTPLEIRPGYIICKERIVTLKSGRFGWDDQCKADVFVYDGTGKATDGREIKTMMEDGKTVFDVRMPSDHLAVLVRKEKN